MGCLAAAGGGVLLSLDSASTRSVVGVASGDGLLVAAALLWSIETVRPWLTPLCPQLRLANRGWLLELGFED